MRFVLGGFALLAMVCSAAAFAFMAIPQEPFAFYKDLGFNWEVIDWAVHTVHSPIDVIDAIAWSPWMYVQLFYLNANVGDVVGIVVSRVVGNSWLAVKIVEVLQIIVAAGGAYTMYATVSPSRTWRLMFAALYASLPMTVLMIRGNEDFGWIFALAPSILAISRTLIRARGLRAIPASGILAAFGGYLIAIEYLLFASLPLLALSLSGAPELFRKRGAVIMLPLGFIACLAIGAFFILPTFVNPILSDSAPRSDSLAANTYLGLFSLDWVGLFILVQREFAASPLPEFNVTRDIPILYLPAAILWSASLGHIVTAKRRSQTWADPISLGIISVCAILSLGATFPFGTKIWALMYSVPHLNGIRTVDRFFAIPPLFVAFWAVIAFERLAARWSSSAAWGACALLVTCTSFVVFDRLQGVLTVDRSIGIREPELSATRAVVTADGFRVASFASLRGGSADDAPMYGRPQPVAWLTSDLGSRFLTDGVGAIGMLGRAGVGDVVTSPSWTYDRSELPNASNVYRLAPQAYKRFSSSEDVEVWSIPHRQAVTAVRLDCVHGGPGPFDILATIPSLSSISFASTAKHCKTDDFVDYDPHDDWQKLGPIDAWSGRALHLSSAALRDTDYPIFLNRTFVNVPWYRNSVDGERTVFDESGAMHLISDSIVTLPPHHAWPRGTIVAIRLASHTIATIRLASRGNTVGSAVLSPRRGFVWYRWVLRRPITPNAALQLSLTFANVDSSIAGWAGVAIDGLVALEPGSKKHAVAPIRARFVAASLPRFEPGTPSNVAGTVMLAPENSTQAAQPILLEALKRVDVAGAHTFTATASVSLARYRWEGPNGTFILAATGQLVPNATLGIGTSETMPCCAVTVPAEAGAATEAVGTFELRHGALIDVQIFSAPFQSSAGDRINSVRILPLRHLVIEPSDTPDKPLDLDLSDPATAMSIFGGNPALMFRSDGVHGRPGAHAALHFSVHGRPRLVTARVASDDNSSEIALGTLTCGPRTSTSSLSGLDTLVVSDADRFQNCTLTFEWGGGRMRIPEITIGIAGGDTRVLRGALWTPMGRYRVTLLRADGTVDETASTHGSGCSLSNRICSFASDGFHDFTLQPSYDDDSLVMFSALAPSAPLTQLQFQPTAALRWDVDVRHPTDIALTQMDDDNWILSNGQTRIESRPCDIVDNCFQNVPPGRYSIFHRWPRQLQLGCAISVFTLAVSLVLLVRPRLGKRPRAVG